MTTELDDLIERYYRLRYMRQPNWMVLEGVPEEMRVGAPNKNGWIQWKLLPWSRGIAPGFEQLEQEIGVMLPFSYKLWYSRYYQVDGDLSFIRFPETSPENPFAELRKEIFDSWWPERIKGIGLISFGSIDYGSFCFDTRHNEKSSDYPIVFWDHDWIDSDKEIIPTKFSSFRELLEYCVQSLLPAELRDNWDDDIFLGRWRNFPGFKS